MTFLHPLGLLGLIGVPILILIYILKNRYTEQTIAATYLWRLSERFLKKRNPLSKITGIISLILQIAFVITISLVIAHPVVTLPGAAKEYCFVLDGSASMSMETDGVTRFDAAKAEINRIIDEADKGSTFSLVYVTDITETVFELEGDKEIAASRINALECADGSVDYTDSIGVAQRLFNGNPSVLTYLVTDTDYAEHTNVNIINVAKTEVNASIYDVTYKSLGGTSYLVSGKAICYGGNLMTEIEVRNNLEDRVLATQTLQLVRDTETPFGITFDSENFYSLTVTSTAVDAMKDDNQTKVYNIKSENAYTALLVSDAPFLLQTALEAVSNAEIEVMTLEAYRDLESSRALEGKSVSGYGLYIYDMYTPASLPTDGTVWLIGPTGNIDGSGFSVQGEVALDEGVEIALNKSTNSVMKKFTGGLSGEGIFLKKYTKCGVYGNFYTIFSYAGNPIVFTGETDAGNREVVFACNLHDTNFTLSSDYPILLYNLLDYSFPTVIEKTEYYCGDTATVNVTPGCTGICVTRPDGSTFYADSMTAVSEILLNDVGEYKITLESAGGDRDFYVYSAVPTAERSTTSANDGVFSIRGVAGTEGRDGQFDPIVILCVLAILLFTAEWVVYCYDKYQLR